MTLELFQSSSRIPIGKILLLSSNSETGKLLKVLKAASFSTTSNMDHQLSRQKSRQKFSVMKTKKLVFPEKQFVSAFQFTFCLEVNRNTSVYVFITEIFLLTFDVIIDDPYLTLQKDSAKITGISNFTNSILIRIVSY